MARPHSKPKRQEFHVVVGRRFHVPGLSVAQVLGLAQRSVESDWTPARAFVERELEGA